MSTLYWSNCVKTFNRYEKCAVTAQLKFGMDYIFIFNKDQKLFYDKRLTPYTTSVDGVIVPWCSV